MSLTLLDHHDLLDGLSDVESTNLFSEFASIDLSEGQHVIDIVVQQFGR